MSRYLTPSKVALLALISIYVEDVVSTGATIAILSFVLSNLLPLIPAKGLKSSTRPALQIEDFEAATAPHVSSRPGRTVWDLLLKRLWAINCFDALHAFFDTLPILLQTREELAFGVEEMRLLEGAPGRRLALSRTSPLGAFVRRAQLEFARLQLDDSLALWKAFGVYREPTFAVWRRRHPTAAATLSVDAELGACANPVIGEILYGDATGVTLRDAGASADDLESLLEFQIDQMQSKHVRETAVAVD